MHISYLQIFIHVLVRWGLVGIGPNESYSHKNDFLLIINDYSLEMGVCYVHLHSFEIICCGWKVVFTFCSKLDSKTFYSFLVLMLYVSLKLI